MCDTSVLFVFFFVLVSHNKVVFFFIIGALTSHHWGIPSLCALAGGASYQCVYVYFCRGARIQATVLQAFHQTLRSVCPWSWGRGLYCVYIIFDWRHLFRVKKWNTKITKKHITRADSTQVRSVRFSSNFFWEVNNFFSFLSLETVFFFFSGVFYNPLLLTASLFLTETSLFFRIVGKQKNEK